MKLAVSNIALPAYDHTETLGNLAELGFSGLEVAPSRVWKETWTGLKPSEVNAYRRSVEAGGLRVVGLHSLFFDHPELGLFKEAMGRAKSLDFLEHLSSVCRDLGGRTLIWGGGRQRRKMPEGSAYRETIDFMADLCFRISGHGTVFCFEPLGPESSDFINSALEARKIVDAVSHPALAIQLDAKALFQNNEATIDIFEAVSDRLVHFHANEPDLGVLGVSNDIDHSEMGALLNAVGYDGYVSLEQRQLDHGDPLDNIANSVEVLRQCYV
jgi:sugar phosphate isomerase/epimerase